MISRDTSPGGLPPVPDDARRLAASVRDACAAAFAEAYEEAGMLGLCAEGRLEAAVGAVRSLDPAALVRAAGAVPDQGSRR